MTCRIWSPLGLAALAALGLAAAASAQGQRNFDAVEIKTTKLADGVYELEGAGGNITASVGEDGVLIVDDQFAPLYPKIKAALAKLSDKPVRYVINTHHHGDHTGGNASFAADGATIIAHENLRKRLEASFTSPANGQPQPVPPGALPTVTYSDELTLHFNGDTIHVIHPVPAHTDGDSIVVFEKANVIAAGDVFRTTSYPRADAAGGGSFTGIVDTYEEIVAHAKPDAKIVPGHGVVSTPKDIQDQLAMFDDIRGPVEKAKKEGKSVEEAIALKPSAKYDERWTEGATNGESIVRALYDAVK